MKVGFIGLGNMAGAMIGGILKKNILNKQDIFGADALQIARENAEKNFQIRVSDQNTEVCDRADILVLSVKPQFYEAVIHEIKDHIRNEQIVISIAPGKTINWLINNFGKTIKVVRCMPNTPALVGEGITGVCRGENVSDEELAKACEIIESFGKAEVVSEHLMDAVVAVSGSSPAYVFMMIEAMADGAVKEGMPRQQAYRFAAQAVLGSAKMVLETGKHPGELKDMVCSPAGTTIEAVRVLEEKGFRSSIIEAMSECAKKSREL